MVSPAFRMSFPRMCSLVTIARNRKKQVDLCQTSVTFPLSATHFKAVSERGFRVSVLQQLCSRPEVKTKLSKLQREGEILRVFWSTFPRPSLSQLTKNLEGPQRLLCQKVRRSGGRGALELSASTKHFCFRTHSESYQSGLRRVLFRIFHARFWMSTCQHASARLNFPTNVLPSEKSVVDTTLSRPYKSSWSIAHTAYSQGRTWWTFETCSWLVPLAPQCKKPAKLLVRPRKLVGNWPWRR